MQDSKEFQDAHCWGRAPDPPRHLNRSLTCLHTVFCTWFAENSGGETCPMIFLARHRRQAQLPLNWKVRDPTGFIREFFLCRFNIWEMCQKQWMFIYAMDGMTMSRSWQMSWHHKRAWDNQNEYCLPIRWVCGLCCRCCILTSLPYLICD